MNLRSVNLNLLTIFDAIMAENNLTRAADKIGMSQPAISLALSQLRQIFGDKLFLRTARGVKPTSKALELSGPIHQALNMIVGALEPSRQFDCSTSQRHFNLVLTELGEATMLPSLMKWLKLQSASVTINTLPSPRPDIERELHFGKVDLYLWPKPIIKDGVITQQLDSENHCCLVRKGHPLANKKLTLKQYAKLDQIMYSMPSDYGPGVITPRLNAKKLERNSHLYVHSYFSVPGVLAKTDYIATVPTRLGRYFCEIYPLQLLDCPIADTYYPIYAMWPSSMNDDPGNKWLRQLLLDKIYRE